MTDRTPAVGDTITTAEELEALPNLTVLHDADQHVIERHGTIEHEGGTSSAWLSTVPPTMCMGEEVDLPATVLHIPDARTLAAGGHRE